jgi:hypothetical protein
MIKSERYYAFKRVSDLFTNNNVSYKSIEFKFNYLIKANKMMYSRSVDISCFINKNNIWNLRWNCTILHSKPWLSDYYKSQLMKFNVMEEIWFIDFMKNI